MNDQVEEIKSRNNIADVVGQYVALKKMGRHQKGLCPFHSEKTPSFLVNEELNLYKCFGCGAGGDSIKFLMEIEGISFLDALERLAERVGIKLEKRSGNNSEIKNEMLEVMELTARYYNWILVSGKSGEVARKYLEGRKISNKIIETYNLGFSLSSWDSLITYLTKKKNYSLELLEKVGLVVKKSGGGYYDKFRGRLMFPLQDSAGRVVGFTGRVLPELAKEGEPKYLNSPETEIYHKGKMLYGFYQAKKAIRENKRVVLVEGQMDQISSYASGITETVAVGGTGITEDQMELMARLASKIYVSLDADDAGYAAIKRSVELAEKRGLNIKVVQIDGGKDPDEIARNSAGLWKKMVESAVDVYEFVMEKAIKKNNDGTPEGIGKVLVEVIPFLSKIENIVIREVWSKRLAEKIGVSLNSVLAEIDKSRSGRSVGVVAKKEEKAVSESRIDKLLKNLIGSLLANQDLTKKTKKILRDIEGTGGLWKLLVFVFDNLESGVEIKDFLLTMPTEMQEVCKDIYMSSEEAETNESNVLDLTVKIAREMIRERRTDLAKDRELAEKNGEEEKEKEILLKLRDLDTRENKLFSLDFA
jgi:DNA primase